MMVSSILSLLMNSGGFILIW